jgi:hypothetical protein
VGDKLGVEVEVRIRLRNLGASFGGQLGLGKLALLASTTPHHCIQAVSLCELQESSAMLGFSLDLYTFISDTLRYGPYG